MSGGVMSLAKGVGPMFGFDTLVVSAVNTLIQLEAAQILGQR